MSLDLDPPLTGETLRARLGEKIMHEALAEGFLYKHASLMISSQPSIGKSVLAIQAALELSNGLPLFGILRVPSAIRVWYIQCERPDIESLERIQLMSEGLPELRFDNLFIDTGLQALSFLNPEHQLKILARGLEIRPDLIMIDPLYGIAGGLSKDEVASQVVKMFTVLKSKLGCALWINHHTVKTTYEIIAGERVEKADPFYGAQWLKAHVTASYLAEMGEKGVVLTNKKDSHSLLVKKLQMEFDEETFLSRAMDLEMNAKDRYIAFIHRLKGEGKTTFFFGDAVKAAGCIPVYVRKLNRLPEIKALFTECKSNGKKTLYKIR